MSQRRSRRPQCAQDNCGSRRFHLDDDGFTYCDQGHQQSDAGLVVSQDTGEMVVTGRTSKRKVESDAESAATTRVSGFTGTKAFEHYVLCLQLVLRKQLRWLIDVQGFPEELEGVVKDLWALRLQKRQNKFSYDGDADTEAQSSRMFSSQSEGDSSDAKTASSRRPRAPGEEPRGPSLTELIGLLYIGMLLLKIPITVADIHKLMNDGDLLFYRAAREVPLGMRDRLPGQLQEQWEPQGFLEAGTIHRKILNLLTSFDEDYGMVAPPINYPLVLYRWIKALSLPLEIYVAMQRLNRLLHLDFGYSLNAKAWSNIGLRFPEIRLMTLVVITTKLLFPFNVAKRYPKAASDLAALQMDWEIWGASRTDGLEAQEAQRGTDPLTFQDAFAMTEAESLTLTDDHLDEYLDWYEGNIASEEVRQRGRAGREAELRQALFRMFPTEGPTKAEAQARPENADAGPPTAERLHQTQSALRAHRTVAEGCADGIPRTGSSYVHYRTVDELTGAARIFHEEAARLAGYPLRGLLRSVFLIERKLVQLEGDLTRLDREAP